MRRCVKRLKMRKAPVVCGVLPEMLMAGGEGVAKWLGSCSIWYGAADKVMDEQGGFSKAVSHVMMSFLQSGRL